MSTAPITTTESVVVLGQQAWSRIDEMVANEQTSSQTDTARLRELWQQVGSALCAGHDEAADEVTFNIWCAKEGFIGMSDRLRAQVMLFSYVPMGRLPRFMSGISHPAAICEWLETDASPEERTNLTANAFRIN